MARYFNNKTAFLKDLAKRVQLREGPEGAERVVRAIYEHEQEPGADALTERTLSRLVRMPVPVILALRREMEAAGMLEPGLSIQMTQNAKKTLADEWGWFATGAAAQSEFPLAPEPLPPVPPAPRRTLRPQRKPAPFQASAPPQDTATSQPSQLCPTCGGTGIAPQGPQWETVRVALEKYFGGGPGKSSGGQQGQPTPATNLRRAAYMHEQSALADRDVLVIGEDVSVAAAVALAGKALSTSGRLARRVVALHGDNRVLKQLRDMAVAEGVLIGLVTHDLHQPLMPDLEREFGAVFVDPPQTYEGFVLYLSRAIDAVKPEGGQIFLSLRRGEAADWLEAQRAILEAGLLIGGVLPGFDEYAGEKRDLYLLQVTEDSMPLVEGDYNEEQAGEASAGSTHRQTYVCTECGRQVAVGGEAGGQFADLRALADAGCPTCGSHTFKLVPSHMQGGNGKG